MDAVFRPHRTLTQSMDSGLPGLADRGGCGARCAWLPRREHKKLCEGQCTLHASLCDYVQGADASALVSTRDAAGMGPRHSR
eukprot:2846345-Pleurochrysis_carterae.AAC.1